MITSRLAIVTVLLAAAQSASAQEAAPADAAATSEPATQASAAPEEDRAGAGLEEIIVTARKKAQGEQLQDVPVAVTAITGARLEETQIQDLSQMTANVPNASLDEVGAAKGTAAFSIRGIAMGSTMPTLESPAGVFVDGIYMASVMGVILDFFDLDGVEVLRGPQGTLFGKNVTAGAVLVRSRKPSDKFEANLRASVETGLEYKLGGVVSGPLSDTVKIRLAAQWDRDDGWFKNDYDGKAYGKGTTWLVRPSVLWEPSDNFDLLVRYEHGRSNTRGLPLQNYAFHDRTTFNFSQDHAGGTLLEWDMISAEANLQVGNGTITSVTGYRDIAIKTDYDTAGTPILDYQINYTNPTEQFSEELRYAGRFFDRLDLTLGLYYFESSIELIETRRLRIVSNFDPRTYGTRQKAYTYAAFAQGDVDITDNLNLTLGLRYTYDKKKADIGLWRAAGDTCNPLTLICTYEYPNQKANWDSWSPKVGLQYVINDDAQIYASWAKGYRAGGFTARQTAPTQNLQWGQESTESYEVGVKADLLDRRLRVNAAGFINKVGDMIRAVTTPGVSGVVNDTRNTGDATIKGFELEATAIIADSLEIHGQVGYQHGQYDTIQFSLYDAPGEPVGTINDTDLNLKLVRVAPWSYGIGFVHTLPIGTKTLRTRADWTYRDGSFTTDDNLSRQNTTQSLDASMTLEINDHVSVSAYGKNLTNHAFSGLVVLLPASLVPPITSGRKPNVGWLSEGRVVGAELRWKF